MIHIANFLESDRLSAKAGETMTQGMVVKVRSDLKGGRELMKVANGDSALLVAGNYAIIYKVSTEAAQVISSTAPAALGDRTVTIVSGDQVVEVRRGAKVEYTADLVDASLDPARAGTTPTPGDKLEIVGALWCKAGTSSSITSPICGRVLRVFGTNFVVELV